MAPCDGVTVQEEQLLTRVQATDRHECDCPQRGDSTCVHTEGRGDRCVYKAQVEPSRWVEGSESSPRKRFSQMVSKANKPEPSASSPLCVHFLSFGLGGSQKAQVQVKGVLIFLKSENQSQFTSQVLRPF